MTSILGSTSHDLIKAGEISVNDFAANVGGPVFYVYVDQNDYINARGGDDQISSGNGRDEVYGGTGKDTIDGGAGNDRLHGGNHNDTILGGSGNDRLWGDNGNDSLDGGEGNDVLRGGSGRDVLDGGAGEDKVFGGSGNDRILDSDTDNDIFRGQGGRDDFVFTDIASGGASETDQILDFVLGQDQIFIELGEPGAKLTINGSKPIGDGGSVAAKAGANVLQYGSQKVEFFVNDPNTSDHMINVDNTNGFGVDIVLI